MASLRVSGYHATRAFYYVASGAATLLAIAGCGRTMQQSRVASPVTAPPIIVRRSEPVVPLVMPATVVSEPPSFGETMRALADSAASAPMWRNARWGMLIVDVTSGDTLVSRDADRLFMPASNQKLLTAAIAVQQLGLDYRWRTPVLLRGRQRGDTWHGDLLVVGSGDPSLSDTLHDGRASRAFDPIIAALAARGIRRIVGDVLAAGDAFTGETTGYGWSFDDADAAYGAPVDELMFNEGELKVRVYGGEKAGAPVRVITSPTTTYPTLQVQARTAIPVARRDRVRAAYDSTTLVLNVTGDIGVRDSVVLTVSYRHPADSYRFALREYLAASGIRMDPTRPAVTGRRVELPVRKPRNAALGHRESNAATSNDSFADTLVVLESPALRDVLPRMQKPSQNQIAELFFRTTGRVVSGDGSADSARAVGARTLAAFGVTAEEIAYRDGSGLSRHDYLTPRSVIKVLNGMRLSPAFDVFRDALPLAGVDGTIGNRMKNTAAAGNAHAKTGTLDKARSLSGYVTTMDGHLVMFSLLCNNFSVATREVERVQDLLVVTIAGSRASISGDARDR